MTNAASDATFDNAKSRYGSFAPEARAYHDCTSGLVDASNKYGAPIVVPNKPKTLGSGPPVGPGSHAASGTIGNAKQAAPSSTVCTTACHRPGTHRTRQCAYRYPPSSAAWKKNRQT